MANPFQAYEACCHLIDGSGLDSKAKIRLKRVARVTQAPPSWGSMHEAIQFTKEFTSLQAGDLDVMLQAANEGHGTSGLTKLATTHPVFYALRKFKESMLARDVKRLAGCLYIYMFSLDRLSRNKLDPQIYYIDAYSARDVLLQFLPDLGWQPDATQNLDPFRKAVLDRCKALIKQRNLDSTKRRKLDRFLEICSGERLPGERQKRKMMRREERRQSLEKIPAESDEMGQSVAYSYPTEDSDISCRTICRVTPKRGSQLAPRDDRRALRGRINGQAARNVISISDRGRLPLPIIVQFLSKVDYPPAIPIAWIALTTGLAPSRLLGIKLGYNGDPHITPDSILTYTVRNPSREKREWLHLQLNPLVGRSISIFSAYLPRLEAMFDNRVKKFSLHNPGPSPTLDRISNSAPLHFSPGILTDLEKAYLSGDIPASLRAQVHYYPIDIASLNQKYQQQHEELAQRILNMQCCSARFRSFLEKMEPFPASLPQGMIGSVHGVPAGSLQGLLDAIQTRADDMTNMLEFTLRYERVRLMAKLIQLQHMQLYILMQLSLGMRKIGEKTSYALASSIGRGWGAEKASAAFSTERKTTPFVGALKTHFDVCLADWKAFVRAAEAAGFLILTANKSNGKANSVIDFDYANPLPLVVHVNEEKRQVEVFKMTSSGFSAQLEKHQIQGLKRNRESKRVHLMKHIVARELVGNVPQVLLDELLSHDRDGLDLCGPWSTASTLSLRLLDHAVNEMLSKLKFQSIRLGGIHE